MLTTSLSDKYLTCISHILLHGHLSLKVLTKILLILMILLTQLILFTLIIQMTTLPLSNWQSQPVQTCVFNIISVMNKLSSFQSFVYSNPFEIYCITETRLSDFVYDHEIIPSKFNIYRKDRKSRGGGSSGSRQWISSIIYHSISW